MHVRPPDLMSQLTSHPTTNKRLAWSVRSLARTDRQQHTTTARSGCHPPQPHHTRTIKQTDTCNEPHGLARAQRCGAQLHLGERRGRHAAVSTYLTVSVRAQAPRSVGSPHALLCSTGSAARLSSHPSDAPRRARCSTRRRRPPRRCPSLPHPRATTPRRQTGS